MKIPFFVLKFSPVLIVLSFLAGCAGSSNGDDLEVPTNLPPICRDIDFVANPDMREMCGVRKVHNKAYKNIPQQRYLIKPAETSIVKTGNKLELRFQNALPLYLTGPIVDEMQFGQEKRLQKVRNVYEYHEIYSKGTRERIRIFKMVIPTDAGTRYDFCYRIPEKKGNARTRNRAMGDNIDEMSCSEFEQIVEADRLAKMK
ncbi:hypothetical protein [Fibrobacter sp.]|uniref:hypothetical protein n=1 Tax=Fibrobacter sp. TaxID=35828 RepID=UPI00388F6967